MLIFLRLILASLLADFVFQPTLLVAWKRRQLRGLLAHAAVVFGLSLLAGVGLWSGRFLLLVILLSALHLAIDWVKILVDERWADGFVPLGTFLVDQALHVLLIGGLLIAFGYVPGITVWRVMARPLMDPHLLALAALYVASVGAGSVIVRLVVQAFQMEVANKPGLLRAGAYIGMVERLLITALVASNQYGAVGFVLAAKSIARYRQMDDPRFAEYYLVGTLTSSAVAVLAGLAIAALPRP